MDFFTTLFGQDYSPLNILVFQVPALWWSILFYIIVELLSRVVANYLYPIPTSAPTSASVSAPTDSSSDSEFPTSPRKKVTFAIDKKSKENTIDIDIKRETIGRYTPSWIHSFICVSLYGYLLIHQSDIGIDNRRVLEQWILGNSFGYFIGDMIVDRDPAYYLHHIAPIIHGEILLRAGGYEYFFGSTAVSGSALYHGGRCLAIIEFGNLISHTAAFLTFRTGSVYHFFLASSLYISRICSMYDGFQSWNSDLGEKKYSAPGLVLLASITLTYMVNIRWMYMMVVAFFSKSYLNNNNTIATSSSTTTPNPNTKLVNKQD